MTEYFSVVIPAKHALACCKAGAGIQPDKEPSEAARCFTGFRHSPE